MVALNTLYLLRHMQHVGQQQIENDYFFQHTVGDGVATDLALDFEAEWLNKIRDLQNEFFITDGLAVYNMGDFGDFTTLPLVDPGTAPSADPLPSFNAVGFTLKLNTRAVRPGSKRIAGIPENVTTGSSITDTAYLAKIELVRLMFQADLVGASDTWTPVVVKRVKTAVPGTTPVQYRYTLPQPPADATVGRVIACLTSPVVTSQVSRKI